MSSRGLPSNQSGSSKPFSSYLAGFILSVLLTLVAYEVVVQHTLSKGVIILLLGAMAATQCVVQLVFFLHLGNELKPRWRLMILGFAVGVVFIVVFGSIWIMDNLNYHMVPQNQMLQYMRTQEGL